MIFVWFKAVWNSWIVMIPDLEESNFLQFFLRAFLFENINSVSLLSNSLSWLGSNIWVSGKYSKSFDKMVFIVEKFGWLDWSGSLDWIKNSANFSMFSLDTNKKGGLLNDFISSSFVKVLSAE